MPVTTSYPGVYIEEIPSGVHTITGVATSITALLGYTPSGPAVPTECFSFADFERNFGGLSADSPLSYAVSQFFQNGGSDAFIVRIAPGAAPASVGLQNGIGGTTVLTVTAASVGTWGNTLQVDVDYNTANPASLFNVTVTQYVQQDGNWVPNRIETFRNLSMDQFASTWAVDTINAGSQLVAASVPGNAPQSLPFGTGQSVSGSIGASDVAALTAGGALNNRVTVSLNGGAPVELAFFDPSSPPASLGDVFNGIVAAVQAALGQTLGGGASATNLTFTASAPPPGQASRSAVHFTPASRSDATHILKLGLAYGGTETDGSASARPLQTGTVGATAIGVPPILPTDSGAVEVDFFVQGGQTGSQVVTVWNPPTIPVPSDYLTAATLLQNALRNSGAALLAGATVSYVGNALRVVAGGSNPSVMLQFQNSGGDSAATQLQVEHTIAGVTQNATHYTLGVGLTEGAQTNAVAGSNGNPPQPVDFVGDPVAKTGMYSLEYVDLFNLLCLVDVTDESVLETAAQYCEQRRAFLILDLPPGIQDVTAAVQWKSDPARGGQIQSRNAACYFPRFFASDPLLNNRTRAFPTCGAMAGIYARTDGERGVWKAPAGIDAYVSGATDLIEKLTNPENGLLNPIAVNCVRAFPVIGIVSWGSRTMRGSDVLADDYKYVPVRRLALFLEESLYRGTQWVVFEPNDEPLWAQIRLNLGAFMHDLFAQGAFAGQTPRDAYFVKCDQTTTTPNDVDLGRVNIIVGFAPLKPAEFVIIQIQQILPALLT